MIVSALIDSREPKEIQALNFGVPSVVMALDAGDAIVTCDDGNTLVVERKTPSDLLGSIKDGRLFQQCHAMREMSGFCYLAIIGRIDMVKNDMVRVDGYRITGWTWQSLQGALLTVQEMGVGIIYASDFKTCIERLAQRDRDDVTIHPRRKSEPMTPDEAFLASLPGVGAIRAKQLLANGPVWFALDWLTNLWDESGIKVPGIGWNQRIAIRNIIGLDGENREYVTAISWESEKDE